MPLWRRDSTSTDPAAGDEELAAVLKPGSLDLGAALALLDSRPKGSETRAHAVHVIGTDHRLDDALAAVGAARVRPGRDVALLAARPGAQPGLGGPRPGGHLDDDRGPARRVPRPARGR